MLFLNVWGFVYCLKVKISNVGRQENKRREKDIFIWGLSIVSILPRESNYSLSVGRFEFLFAYKI